MRPRAEVDELVDGVRECVALKAWHIECVVKVCVDLQHPRLTTKAEVVQPDLVDVQSGEAHGSAYQARVLPGELLFVHDEHLTGLICEFVKYIPGDLEQRQTSAARTTQ